nr:MAG TPA: hydrogenase/urease nickel incorporation protein [Caudoviricetes sp.]
MAEYIEREALIAEFKRLGLGENGLVERVFAEGVYTVIEAIPAADVAPVVHAYWIPCDNGGYFCSNCDKRAGFRFDLEYCPRCGAKMDGGVENG